VTACEPECASSADWASDDAGAEQAGVRQRVEAADRIEDLANALGDLAISTEGSAT
jgi:hypothetical protein